MSLFTEYRDAAEKRIAELEEQLEAATSDDFSLVPKAEYARLKGIEEQFDAHEKALRDLRHRADSGEVLGVDISDYSDEFCAGFLAGQSQALDQALDSFPASELSAEEIAQRVRDGEERPGPDWQAIP